MLDNTRPCTIYIVYTSQNTPYTMASFANFAFLMQWRESGGFLISFFVHRRYVPKVTTSQFVDLEWKGIHFGHMTKS